MLAALLLFGFALALLPLLDAALPFLPVVLGLLAALGSIRLLGLHALGMVGLALTLLGSTSGGLAGAGTLYLLQRWRIQSRFARMRLQWRRRCALGLLGVDFAQAPGRALLALLLVQLQLTGPQRGQLCTGGIAHVLQAAFHGKALVAGFFIFGLGLRDGRTLLGNSTALLNALRNSSCIRRGNISGLHQGTSGGKGKGKKLHGHDYPGVCLLVPWNCFRVERLPRITAHQAGSKSPARPYSTH